MSVSRNHNMAFFNHRGSALVIALVISVLVVSVAFFFGSTLVSFSKLSQGNRSESLLVMSAHSTAALLKQELSENYAAFRDTANTAWAPCRTSRDVTNFLGILQNPSSSYASNGGTCPNVPFQWSFFRTGPDSGSSSVSLGDLSSSSFYLINPTSQLGFYVKFLDFNLSNDRNQIQFEIVFYENAKKAFHSPRKMVSVIDLKRTVEPPAENEKCKICRPIPGSVCCLRPALPCAGVGYAFDAEDVDGDGEKNSGTIDALTTPTWTEHSEGTKQGTLTSFNFGTATSGWKGDGSIASPYRLEFDGSDDRVLLGSYEPLRTYAAWFRGDELLESGGSIVLLCRPPFGNLEEITYRVGSVQTVFTGGFYYGVGSGIETGGWHHFAATLDGSEVKAYLDGVYIGSRGSQVVRNGSAVCTLGAEANGFYASKGAIAQVLLCQEKMTEEQVLALYLSGRKRFQADPGVARIERVFPANLPAASPQAFSLFGWNLNGVSSLTLGGSSASGVQSIQGARVNATSMIHTTGDFAAVVTASAGTDTKSLAVRFTETPTNDSVYFDAANADGAGTPGPLAGSKIWKSLSNARTAGLQKFVSPFGWKGVGTPSDPYRIDFDGVDDEVTLGLMDPARAYAIWLRLDDVINGKTIFSCANGGGYYENFDIRDGILSGVFSGWSIYTQPGTGVSAGEWYHFAISNDGTNEALYLNGVPVHKRAATAVRTTPAFCRLGTGSSGMWNFRGAVAQLRIFPNGLTDDQVLKIYEEGRGRFQTAPTTARLDRAIPAVSGTAGGAPLALYGWNLQNITSVTLNGSSVPTPVVYSSSRITGTVPAGSGTLDPYRPIAVSGGAPFGSDTKNAFSYSDTMAIVPRYFLDASNIDSVGTRGSSAAQRTWSSLSNARTASLMGFGATNTATSGWQGTGTTADPYRLEMDGTDDLVALGITEPVATYSLWFRGRTNYPAPGSAGVILTCYSGSSHADLVELRGGQLGFVLNDSALGGRHYTPVLGNKWYHLVMVHDGTSAKFYLNENTLGNGGDLINGAVPVYTRPAPPGIRVAAGMCYIGLKFWSFGGAISSLRLYSQALTPIQIAEIYNEERGRFY